MKKKTVFNILLIAFVVSFFVTPLGHYGKVWLNRIFAPTPTVIEVSQRKQIKDYDWKLKDNQWNFFNFEKSKGNVIFINQWASWRMPCEAELRSIQKLYDTYKEKVDFYIITNEERPPVEKFMEEKKFTFPVTYLIIGEKMPINSAIVPSSYLIGKNGDIIIYEETIADWDNNKVDEAIKKLLNE